MVEQFSRRDVISKSFYSVLSCSLSLLLTRSAKASNRLKHIHSSIEAPKFQITDLEGKVHNSLHYNGKVVLISFWAVWCPPCRKELPSLARLNRDIPSDKFSVLAVNLGDPLDKVQKFLDQIDHQGLPILLDLKSHSTTQWFINGLPISYVIDQKGEIKFAAIGALEWDHPSIKKQLKSLF